MPDDITADWIAAAQDGADLRLWAMHGARAVAQTRCSPDDLRRAVAALTGALPPVTVCGLPQARLRKVPCAALPDTLPTLAVGGLTVRAVPGLRQDSPAHVMQGAETAIAGFLALNPTFDGVLCLPGEVTAWAHISAEEVVSFQTFLTVGMARLLEDRLGLSGTGWADDGFADALSEMMARPERLAGRLASLHAQGRLGTPPADAARARLWGALIGTELAAARPYWLGQQVAVIGGGEIARAYATAITAQGLPPVEAGDEAMLLNGLAAAKART
ncbi:2-dehydro-3-deoxygalactonokinase [Actibacterium sp. D379-3]